MLVLRLIKRHQNNILDTKQQYTVRITNNLQLIKLLI